MTGFLIEWESANVFCKGPDRKYFRLCESLAVAATQLCHCDVEVAADNTEANECDSAPGTPYFIDTEIRISYNFYMSQNIIFSSNLKM